MTRCTKYLPSLWPGSFCDRSAYRSRTQSPPGTALSRCFGGGSSGNHSGIMFENTLTMGLKQSKTLRYVLTPRHRVPGPAFETHTAYLG